MIISVLGLAGEFQGEKTTAYYGADVLNKKSGDYHNSTDFLLKNYNDKFYLLGTKTAIECQKRLLDFPLESEFYEVSDNNLDDVFEKVFELISMAKDEKVLLDITHGFRDQSISAIFSGTLHIFLNQSNVEIIFAKQEQAFVKYEYLLMKNYINITQLALLFTGFIRTLNFVNSVEVENLNTLAFENFSKALLSNDFKKLEFSYKNLSASLKEAKKRKEFDYLKELFIQIEETLQGFQSFGEKKLHEKYMILAKIMVEKNYSLLALTYLFEAIRLYVSYSFFRKKIISHHAWHNVDMYRLNSESISCICQKEFGKRYRKTRYDKNDFYENNFRIFEPIAKEYKKLRELRNDLTHINHKKSSPNINNDLKVLLESVGRLIENDVLQELKK